jgi:CheY-like chemotaxis protein
LSSSKALSILVVDDDGLVSMGTVAMLEDLGHFAMEAASAAQALEILGSSQRFDLVITDHAMPGMTGAELARFIFSSFPGVPVILASGYAELPNDHGLSDLLRVTKPFTQEQLETAVQRAIAERATAA